MARALTLGNGSILVGLDGRGQVRDFYFPHVGLENHVNSRLKHRIGVFVDGALHWFDDPAWHIVLSSSKEAMAGSLEAIHDGIGIAVGIENIVYNEKNIFVREFTIRNTRKDARTVKVFLGQEFRISESRRGDTGYFDPRCQALVHYKGKHVFLVNARGKDGVPFDEYSVGLFEIEGREGTYRDAEDGTLDRNPIEHGSVDSVLGVSLSLGGEEERQFNYWIAAGETIAETIRLNNYIISKSPAHLIRTTSDFWHAWVNRQNFSFYGLDDSVVDLFKKSLFVIRAHADREGAIIASSDSDMLQYGRDTYSYLWPRDAARAALALDKAGDFNVAQRFFAFCNDVIADEGYFMHKSLSDKSLGSSWHPWVRDGKPELPIQEDETALVVHSLWQHYKLAKDLEFIEQIYNSLLERAGNFMLNFMHAPSGLVAPSYDLWEEKYGISTFTASAVHGAFDGLEHFATTLGKLDKAQRYREAKETLREAIITHLYDPERKMFSKLVLPEGGALHADDVVDMSSVYGIYAFGVLPATDSRVVDSIKTIERVLRESNTMGGVLRYEGDDYLAMRPHEAANPWLITTLWLAQYYIQIAQSEADFKKVHDIFAWIVERASDSSMLSEQVDPHTGEPVGAMPLVWSHSEFVITVVLYLEKLEELGICDACYPLQ